MLFRGPEAMPLVSLITSGEREAIRRALLHMAISVRSEMELTERDALGTFVDSVTSTSGGAVLVKVLNDDLLIVALVGETLSIADAWKAIQNERAEIAAAASALLT